MCIRDRWKSERPLAQKLVQAVTNVAFVTWSATFQLLGAAAAAGLLLNVCGLGYRFQPEPPFVEFGTLSELRRDNRELRFERRADLDFQLLDSQGSQGDSREKD